MDVLTLLTIVVLCVAGAEATRRACRRQLAAIPVPARETAAPHTPHLDRA